MFRRYTSFVAILSLAGGLAAQEPHFQGYADIDDIRMYFEVHGEGEPILLLHGGTGNGKNWSEIVPILSARYWLVVPDSRSQGRTTDSQKPLSYDLMADDVIELLDHLEIERAHVVGASDGGIIGLNLAMRYPDRVKKLVVYGASFQPSGMTDESLAYVKDLSPENYGIGADANYLNVAPDPTHFGEMLSKIQSMWLSQPVWTEDDLAKIKRPIFVIDDTLGLTIRPEHVRAMAAAIPGARFTLIDDTDHQAYKDKPEEFSQLIIEFLSDR